MTDSPDDAAQDPAPIDGGAVGQDMGTQWCRKCKTDVVPRGAGLCPQCGQFLRRHTAWRKHSPDTKLRDQYLSDLLEEYQPRTTVDKAACRQLANVLARLETEELGSTDRQRIVAERQELVAQLDASRTSRPDGMSEIEAAADALSKLTNAELKAKLAELYASLNDVDEQEKARAAMLAAEASAPKLEPPAATPAPPAPEPPAPCPYCYLPPAECEALKSSNTYAWRVAHEQDPQEIVRRREEATKEMLESMKFPLPDWYRTLR